MVTFIWLFLFATYSIVLYSALSREKENIFLLKPEEIRVGRIYYFWEIIDVENRPANDIEFLELVKSHYLLELTKQYPNSHVSLTTPHGSEGIFQFIATKAR